jgi:hypothetical protein
VQLFPSSTSCFIGREGTAIALSAHFSPIFNPIIKKKPPDNHVKRSISTDAPEETHVELYNITRSEGINLIINGILQILTNELDRGKYLHFLL